MPSLPADRTKLALAQSNQNPSNVLGSSQNKNALTEAYDTIDLLYNNMTGLISSAQLSKLGLNNVKDYNASGSAQTTTGSINAGSNILTLATALDFANGQGIAINHAGAACTLATPGVPTVIPTGAVGTTPYQYQIVALDTNGGCTAAGTTGTTTTGNASLSSTNYNALSWTAVANTPTYAVYGRVSGTMQLLAIVNTTTWNDTGSAAINTSILPSVPPTSALSDWLVTTISSGGGTTNLTLATSATTSSINQTVNHDDTAAIQNAIQAAASLVTKQLVSNNWAYVGGTVYLPPGKYVISNKLYLSEGITFKGLDRNNTLIIMNNVAVTQAITNRDKTIVQGYQTISIQNISFNYAGIYLLQAYKSYVKNVNIYNVSGDYGILTQLSVETIIEDVFIQNATTGIYLSGGAGGGPSTTNKLNRVWLSRCGTGLQVSGSPYSVDTSFIKNSVVEYCSGVGVKIAGVTKGFTIDNIHFEQNAGYDIEAYDLNTNLSISNILSDVTGIRVVLYGSTATANSTINVHNVDPAVFIQNGFTGKVFCSGTTNNLGTLPSGARVYNYPPSTLSASGTATIAGTTTTIVVNHGLSAAPTNVIVTPQGNIGSYWVSSITATQFTINCSTAPAGNTPVSWKASL